VGDDDETEDGRSTSMSRGSKTPGLKFAHGRAYRIALQIVRDTLGFPDKCIRLPPNADEATLARLCEDHTARLRQWIEANPEQRGLPTYDGTVKSLSRLYQQHPDSPFGEVKHNTRKGYTDSLKVIEATVGKRRVGRVTVVDVRRWHRNWKAPKSECERLRIKRAHDAVSMFRTILRFGAALRHKECATLDQKLAMIRFERGSAREQEMTYGQVCAVICKAEEVGRGGLWPIE
jgi:hypothetical protein